VLGGCVRGLGAGRLPGGTPPFGYVRRGDRWEAEAPVADAVRFGFARYDRGGITLQGLADELTALGYPPPDRKGARRGKPPAWAWGQLKRILKNPQYTGAVVWGRRSQGKYNRDGCREWVGALVQAVPRRGEAEVAGALRGLLVVGVRQVEVNWRTVPFGKRQRNISQGGVVELHGSNWSALRQLSAW
jgi:hypothetical protein